MAKRMARFGLAGGGVQQGDTVLRVGKIWHVDNYPDHGITDASVEKARKSNAGFTGAKVNSAHGRSVFDRLEGGLGNLAALTIRDDGEVIGAVQCPKWLDDLFQGQELPVSAEVDTDTLEIVGLAFEDDPALTDAKVMAAFAAAHPPAKTQPAKKEGGRKMKWKDILARFSKADIPEGGTIDDVEIDVSGDDTTDRLRKELADEKAAREKAETAVGEFAKSESARQEAALKLAAEAVVDEYIRNDKALPAERDALIGEFCDAVKDDATEGKVACFSADGKVAEGRRVARFKKHYDDKPKHGLTAEQSGKAKFKTVGADDENAGAGGSAMTPARKSQLMASSTLGRTVLNNANKAGGQK